MEDPQISALPTVAYTEEAKKARTMRMKSAASIPVSEIMSEVVKDEGIEEEADSG